MQREFMGEPYPADVTEKKFDAIVCVRIIGTEEEIRLTTDLYTARYSVAEFATEAWGDARFLYYQRSPEGRTLLVYELLLFRRHEP